MRLAILGASARAAACSALDAGHQVSAADLFADTDLLSRCCATRIRDWPEGFAAWLDSQSVDAWLYTGGLENYPEVVDRLASIRPLLGCGSQQLHLARSARTLACMFAAHGVAYATVRFTPPIDSLAEDNTAAVDATSREWLIKSPESAGGLGVRDWQHDQVFATDDYWQRKVEGRSISAAYVSAGGIATLLGITEQLIDRPWTGAKRYQYAGSVGPLEVDAAVQTKIEQVGNVLAVEARLVGLFGVDFLLDAKGVPWVVEVNPRYTASMEIVERYTTLSSIGLHLAACTEGVVPERRELSGAGYCGKAYLFAKASVQAPALTADNIADVPTPGERFESGDPVCTLFANSAEYSGVEQALKQRTAAIEAQLLRG